MKSDFQKLKQDINSCSDCRNLFGFEPIPIFQGNKNAKIFQISQAPSKKIQDNKKSFKDASGKKLKTQWYKISDKDFYNKSNFYIYLALLLVILERTHMVEIDSPQNTVQING